MTQSPRRRAPHQERGERRIAQILDAAAQVIDEVGYEAATTVAIAARAHTAIGSLYQFFPNKEAILHELLERYHTQLSAVLDGVITPVLVTLPLATLLDRMVDPLMAFELGQKGFKALFTGVPTDPDLARATHVLEEEVVGRIAAIFQARLPHLEPRLAYRYSLISVHLVKTFLSLAASPTIMTRAEAISELKVVLLGYLTTIVG
jgi:AcrR family transcriptional regulator